MVCEYILRNGLGCVDHDFFPGTPTNGPDRLVARKEGAATAVLADGRAAILGGKDFSGEAAILQCPGLS